VRRLPNLRAGTAVFCLASGSPRTPG
jgi:hypothetical protein